MASEVILNTYKTLDQSEVRLLPFNNGSVLVTWMGKASTGSAYELYGKVFSINLCSTG